MTNLISGKEALIALANGEEVEYSFVGDWFVVDLKTELGIFHRTDVAFRLKPRTITLNIEIPAPFEPKDGDTYWTFHPAFKCGYTKVQYLDISKDKHKTQMQFGAWRTEDEIKQVVAALRQVFGAGNE